MAAIAALSTASAVRPAALGCAGGACAAPSVPRRSMLAPVPLACAPRRLTPRKIAARAEKGGGAGSDEELEKQSFQSLASQVASSIAEAYKGQELSGTKLASWLSEVSSLGDVAQKGADATKEAAQGGSAGVGGTLKKAASVVGSVLGAGHIGEQHPRKPWEAAAHYLGADSLSLTPESLMGWLTSPKRKDDAKWVGALVMMMMKYHEKKTGESWEGKDHQYSYLYHLAQELFGGKMSIRLVKSLVNAYLHVAAR